MPARKSERSTRGSSEKSAVNGGIHLKNTQSTKIKRKPTQKKSNTKSEGTSPGENNTKEVKLGGSSSGNGKKSGSLQINGSSVAERTFQHFAGCHVSAAGGVDNAIQNALDVNAKSFALFLRNQRSWTAKPLDLEVAARFKELCVKHNFPPHLIIPHGSYLVNLGSPSMETREKSIITFIDELNRCSQLGLTMFNIHPGSSCGKISRDECIKLIAEGINKALAATSGVKVVLENMSCQGNTIGGDFNEIRSIMDLVEDKSRIGVCIDTCHAMAAGFDLSTQAGFDGMIVDFERIIGFEWLVALHLNDSKGEAGCHLDRHETIGKGKIGVEGFKRIMNCQHFTDIPMVLETPFNEGNQSYTKEIKLLNSLSITSQ